MHSLYPIGFRKGRLVVCGDPVAVETISHRKSDGRAYKRKRIYFPCKCDCGVEKLIPEGGMYDNRVQSCGCLKKAMYLSNRRHNTSYHSWSTRLYLIWKQMIRRCHNSKSPNRIYYHDRGIKVCDEWSDDFSAFERWSLENGYREDLQIDRIDVNGNYEPSNCRWITARENSCNRRNNVEIVYNGKKIKLVDLIYKARCKIDVRTVYKRILCHGWDVDRALTEPKHYQSRKTRLFHTKTGGNDDRE